MKSQMKSQAKQSKLNKTQKPLKASRRKVHSKRTKQAVKSNNQRTLASQTEVALSNFQAPTFSLNLFQHSQSFLPSRPLFALGGGRSKSEPTKKRFEAPVKVKKELSADDKDKKKLEKLEREKAKQATRQAQIVRSTERSKKELELNTKKQAQLQDLFQKARLNVVEVDDKERAELEANEKRNALEEEKEKAARALRRSTGDDV